MSRWKKIALVGVGMMGGSIGQALIERRLAEAVVGIGRSAASLRRARAAGAVTEATTNLARGVAGADLVVVCTPVGQIADYVDKALRAAGAAALVTDIGSTKGQIVADVTRAQRASAVNTDGARFVGSHPLCGSEKSGPEFASADLFVGRVVVVTPTPATQAADVERLIEFWSALGAGVECMSPAEHDRALAITSHLPHLAAAAIAGVVPEGYLTLTASGWQDTTRVAAGSAGLWREILLSNRREVGRALALLARRLKEFRAALADQDAQELESLLADGKKKRDAVGS